MNTFEWCGYHWRNDMNGRIIHQDQPWMWYGNDVININENGSIELKIKFNPRKIEYMGTEYYSKYEVPVLRSIEEFGYGTYSCDIRLPEGYGLWPAFWLTGSKNWPPEIDIMEAWSKNSDYYVFPLSRRITNDVHYNEDTLRHCHIGSKNTSMLKCVKNPMDNFVEYKCVWKPDSITFYMNGNQTRKITGDVCRKLTEHLKHPESGWKMNVIFDFWCKNSSYNRVNMFKPMYIKNFKYEHLYEPL